jgi:hypothetical protein
MAAPTQPLAHRSEESPVRRRPNAPATVVAAALLLIVVVPPAAVVAAPDPPATVRRDSPAQDTRPVPTLTLAIAPAAVGARGVVTATVSFTPAPAIADTGGWIRFTNPATTWGESIRVSVDAAGMGSVEIGTQFWQSGTWTGVLEFPGSAELAPAMSPPASVTINVPTDPPPALDDPRVISVGGRHACALDENGRVSCWGAMLDGGEALGEGVFRDVSVGGEYTCAVRADGTLTCWGDAPYPQGQKPDGTFLRVVTKDTFGCALRVDGTLACWGPYEYRDDILNPPHGAFVALTGQSANSCALDAEGNPSCWGGPGGVQGMLPGPFDQVAAGGSFACGLRPSGAVECWGLGVGAGFAPAGTYTKISAWGQALCALRTDGSIRCWGDAFDAPPAEIQGEFVDVAAGPEVACARRATGELACFGGETDTLGLVPRVISTPPVIGTVGVPYEHQLRMTTVFPSPAWTVAEGSLPPGVTLSPTGRIAGTPTASGLYAAVVEASNGLAPAARRSLELDIAPASALETGPVVVNGGASTTNTAVTSVFHPATGAGEVRLSNDGTKWVVRPYAATTASWSLVDPATGGTAGDGTKRVWVSWRAAGGSWSTPVSDTILLDRSAPRVAAPAATLVSGGVVAAGRAPVRVGWSGTDSGSGIARYELAESRDGGAWASVAATLTATSTTRSLVPGHAYRFRLRAFDAAGNASAWAYGTAARLNGHQETSSALRYRGTWQRATSAAYWGGGARAASTGGATASFSFTARAVAWVTTRGPTRGVARVYVNGIAVATVDLRSSATQPARVVFARAWSATATRTLTIRVSGTPGRPRVDLDGMLTLR